MLFSVNIHGTLKYIFANCREDSWNTYVHVRYFPWKYQKNALFSVTLYAPITVFPSLVAVKLLWFFGSVAIFNSLPLCTFHLHVVCLYVRDRLWLWRIVTNRLEMWLYLAKTRAVELHVSQYYGPFTAACAACGQSRAAWCAPCTWRLCGGPCLQRGPRPITCLEQ